MTDELKTTITQTLEHTSRDVLETLFDAAVFEEHLALVLEGIDDANLEREITELLMTCLVVPEEEGTFLFSSLEALRFFMAEVTRLIETTQAAVDDEFIVFSRSSLTAPETLPEVDTESLEFTEDWPIYFLTNRHLHARCFDVAIEDL